MHHAEEPPVWGVLNLDLLRSLFAVVECGSLSKAAGQLRVSQSTVTRHIQALETEIGGHLLARGHHGAALTAAGHALVKGMRPLVTKADGVISDVRKLARGQSASLRVGYLMSAAAEFLTPAIAALRESHPEIKVRLVDLSPAEQIRALRDGELDVIMLGNLNADIPREFYVRRIATLPVMVALPAAHPLAQPESLTLGDLRHELFIGARADTIPGFNHWIKQACRPFRFRPRFVEDATSMTHTLTLLVAENAVTLLPSLAAGLRVPGVVFRPLRAPRLRWELQLAWQRGRITEPVRELVNVFADSTRDTRAGRSQTARSRNPAGRPGLGHAGSA